MSKRSLISECRGQFHESLAGSILGLNENGNPSNADGESALSVKIASGILDRLAATRNIGRLPPQRAGKHFEEACLSFLHKTYLKLTHIRPGAWAINRGTGKEFLISHFEQYEHLSDLNALLEQNPKLEATLGPDYLIKPDIVVSRMPLSEANINEHENLIDKTHSLRTPLRLSNNKKPFLHASISCKWTVRSDRAQNARSEALNLVRNRKGRLPHIVVVTAEPLPSRIASLALGTGDIDCVYHFALTELIEAIESAGNGPASAKLLTMIDGRRLRDISDLPLDLAI